MIQLPRRSVTRFFIPLIDVWTLLFCIFLLMPLVKTENPETPVSDPTRDASDPFGQVMQTTPPEDADAQENSDAIRDQARALLKLRAEQIETLQERLAVRVLEIDPDSGRLYYYEPEQRIEIASQADARRFIQRQKRDAPGREIYYLFLYPRRITGYPQERQIKQYERWFEGVAHGFDNPRGAR